MNTKNEIERIQTRVSHSNNMPYPNIVDDVEWLCDELEKERKRSYNFMKKASELLKRSRDFYKLANLFSEKGKQGIAAINRVKDLMFQYGFERESFTLDDLKYIHDGDRVK